MSGPNVFESLPEICIKRRRSLRRLRSNSATLPIE